MAGGRLLVGASLPPVGLWPLALVGLAPIDRSVRHALVVARFRRDWLAGVALLGSTPGRWLVHCRIDHHLTNDGVDEDGAGGLTMVIDVAA